MDKLAEEAQAVLKNARCLYNSDAIVAAVDNLAERITTELQHSNPVVIAVMNGGLIPAGMILSRLDFLLHVDYLHATRYRGNTRGGELNWIVKPQHDLHGRSVLIIDDILDEGLTLQAIIDFCHEQGASQVYSCVLVEKQHDRKIGDIDADFVGLQVEDAYVFGCGMDYKNYLRNVNGIYAVEE